MAGFFGCLLPNSVEIHVVVEISHCHNAVDVEAKETLPLCLSW